MAASFATSQIAVPTHRSNQVRVGRWRIDVLNGGRFLMDGGVLFGVVPRRLWQMARAPDELNRLPCACNCLLARDGHHTVLIDAGYGGKQSPLDRKFYALDEGEPLLAELRRVEVAPEEIDQVVMTHLHWDHAGGLTRRDGDGALRAVFASARHAIGRVEWEDAWAGGAELAGAYSAENIEPLREKVAIDLVEDGDLILPGIRALRTGGHTRGHLAIVIESDGETAICMSDLCPSTLHMRRLWALAYDLYPLETRREKPRLLGQAADENWIVLWSHDPRYVASRLGRDPKREFVIAEAWSAD